MSGSTDAGVPGASYTGSSTGGATGGTTGAAVGFPASKSPK